MTKLRCIYSALNLMNKLPHGTVFCSNDVVVFVAVVVFVYIEDDDDGDIDNNNNYYYF